MDSYREMELCQTHWLQADKEDLIAFETRSATARNSSLFFKGWVALDVLQRATEQAQG